MIDATTLTAFLAMSSIAAVGAAAGWVMVKFGDHAIHHLKTVKAAPQRPLAHLSECETRLGLHNSPTAKAPFGWDVIEA